MLNQKGAVQFIVILILLAGIAVLLYLVQTKTNLFPKASVSSPISTPINIDDDYCKQFVVEEGVCGQPSFDHCNFSCDENGRAFYNCFPSDQRAAEVCSGAIYCEGEDYKCQNTPCPPGTSEVETDSGTICVGNLPTSPTEVPSETQSTTFPDIMNMFFPQ